MPVVSIRERPVMKEGLYRLRFLSADVYPKTPEEAARMGFRGGQQYNWQFVTVGGNYNSVPASGLTPMEWSPKNKLGKWIATLGGVVQKGQEFEINSLAGRETMGHVVPYESKKTGVLINSVRDLFPLEGLAPETVSQPENVKQGLEKPKVDSSDNSQVKTKGFFSSQRGAIKW